MNVLIMAAHPDDAEFGMGGTLIKLSKKHNVTIAVLTDGSAGTFNDPVKRKQEQEKAAEMIGATLHWDGWKDCSLEFTRKLSLHISSLIRKYKPDVVFTPHPVQTGGVNDGRAHPDHRKLGLATRDGTRYARFNIEELEGEKHRVQQLMYYMVPTPGNAKFFVDVSDVIDELHPLFDCHESQTQLWDSEIKDFLIEVYRKHEMTPGLEYAEMFDADDPISVEIIKELF